MTSKPIAFAFAMVAAAAMGGAAPAQDVPRVYDYGPVIEVTDLLVEPGKLRAYMAYLNGPWRKAFEDEKRRGDVLDYRVYAPIDGKRSEGNLQLVITYRGAGVWDTPLDEQDRRTAHNRAASGANDEQAAAAAKMRTILGTRLFRELKFNGPPK